MSLFTLTSELRILRDMAEDPDTDPEVLRDTMEAVTGDFYAKADAYAMVMADMDADDAAITAEIERLTARRAAIRAGKARLLARLLDAMKETGLTKFKTALRSFGIRRNPEKVVITSEDVWTFPADYLKIPDPVPNKDAIKKALKAGTVLPFAHLERTESLVIR